MPKNQWRIWLAVAGVLIAVLALVAAQPGKQRPPIRRGAPLPKVIAGKDYVSLNASQFGDLRQKLLGKVVLVNFWATWCGPCQMEIPHLERLYQKYKKQDFVLLGVANDVPYDHVLEMFESQLGVEMTYPVIQDSANEIGSQFGINSLPTTFIYDRYGEQRYTMRGFGPDLYTEWDELVGQLLAE